eukprot:1336287-Amorphochlora_amoeboformis.AAC.1
MGTADLPVLGSIGVLCLTVDLNTKQPQAAQLRLGIGGLDLEIPIEGILLIEAMAVAMHGA